MIDNTQLDSTKTRALRMLSRRAHSAREIEKKLIEKGESAENARQTAEWLEKIGYINDAEYAESVARHYQGKGYGQARIKDELYRRGIPRDHWDDALDALEETQAEYAADRFLDKKLRGGRDKDDLRRAMEALVRRGFSFDEARAAVNSYLDRTECQKTLD